MKTTTANPTTANPTLTAPQQAPEWLLTDLAAVLDHCAADGDFETVEAILEGAAQEDYQDDLANAPHWQQAGTSDDWASK